MDFCSPRYIFSPRCQLDSVVILLMWRLKSAGLFQRGDSNWRSSVFYKRWDELSSFAVGTVAELASAFLAFVLDVSGHAVLVNVTWRELAQKVVSVSGDTQAAIGQWAIFGAGLLAAPESGLPEAEANEWLDCLREEAQKCAKWSVFCNILTSSRWERVRLALAEASKPLSFRVEDDQQSEKSIAAILDEIDARGTGYKWRALVETAAP